MARSAKNFENIRYFRAILKYFLIKAIYFCNRRWRRKTKLVPNRKIPTLEFGAGCGSGGGSPNKRQKPLRFDWKRKIFVPKRNSLQFVVKVDVQPKKCTKTKKNFENKSKNDHFEGNFHYYGRRRRPRKFYLGPPNK